jgi:hypothetical protein
MLLRCTCSHSYQDKKYGKGIRVCNATEKGNAVLVTYRCTVCTAMLQKEVRTREPINAQ